MSVLCQKLAITGSLKQCLFPKSCHTAPVELIYVFRVEYVIRAR